MSMRITLHLVVACSLSLFCATELLAQGILSGQSVGSRGSTSTGMFGSRTVGTGSARTGTRNAFGGGQGQGALGGTTGGSRIDQLIGAEQGTVTGTERFIRGNRDASAFVGSDQAETSTFVGALSGGASRIQGAIGNLGFMGNRNRPEVNNETNNRRSVTIRTKLTVGFRYPRMSQSSVMANAQEHLNIPALSRFGTIRVELDDRTATLHGTVATADDRELAVRLARLEPGVSAVVDQLTVSEESATESPSDSIP